MVIYRPKEEQRYYYYGVDHTEVYWVHFTGSNVKNILRKYGIADNLHTIHTGASLEYKNLFLAMIQELKFCKADYEELLVSLLQHLLILIHRSTIEKPYSGSSSSIKEIDDAVRYFHANYQGLINVQDYAKAHNISKSWFIQLFKEYTSMTPNQYIQSLRLSNAQSLLESTEYNVTEVANIVGYDNALYFSRLFRKQVGMSPSEFRKQLRENACCGSDVLSSIP